MIRKTLNQLLFCAGIACAGVSMFAGNKKGKSGDGSEKDGAEDAAGALFPGPPIKALMSGFFVSASAVSNFPSSSKPKPE